VFIGLDPNTGFLNGALDVDRRGLLVTDDTFATSLPGVYAAGDVRAGSTKQLGAAVGEALPRCCTPASTCSAAEPPRRSQSTHDRAGQPDLHRPLKTV